MKGITITTCILLLCISCANEVKHKSSGELPTINIDVSALKSVMVNKLSDIYEALEMIGLETRDESVIQKIDKIEIHDQNIYILDSKGAKALLVFSIDGKYKYKIGSIGNGPGEYIEPIDFDVDDSQIRILSFKKLIIYDKFGKFKRNIALNFMAQNILNLSADYDAYYGSGLEDRIIVANKTGLMKFSSFKYSPKNRMTPFALQKTDSLTLFNIPYCDTIFNVTKDAVAPYCVINFGKAAFTNDDYIRHSTHNDFNVADYIINSNNYAFKAYFSVTQDHYILSFGYLKRPVCCIQSKNIQSKIYYDLLACTDDIWFSKTFAIPSGITKENKLIFVQNYPELIIAGQKYLTEKAGLNNLSKFEESRLDALNKICKGMNELSNPVLFIAKIRD